MPRIDPLQLLNCLSVLLRPNGGIKSTDEVQRLASLMTKFSKKLVSKCIYVQILRNTETGLLGRFMGGGGWNLAHQWLSDAILAQNLPFIKELLELLLMCPVDVERLKLNNCPKLIKNLTKEASNEEVRQLASRLVEQWLRIVKGQTAACSAISTAIVPDVVVPTEVAVMASEIQEAVAVEQEAAVDHPEEPSGEPAEEPAAEPLAEPEVEERLTDIVTQEVKECSEDSNDASAWDGPNGTLPVYKITIKDGKQMLSKVPTSERTPRKQSFDSATLKHDVPKITTNIVAKRVSDPVPVVSKKKVDSVASAQSVKSKSTKAEREQEMKKKVKNITMKIQENASSEKKIKLIEPSKEKPSEAMTEKERVKERRERELNKLKEKKLEKAAAQLEKAAAQLEKDKATLAKLVPPPISKLGKIPKKPRPDEGPKSADKKPEKSPEHKRSPLSPDVKRNSTEGSRGVGRPKGSGTVKVFTSKPRSTGLEEEAKPPKSSSSSSSSSRRLSGSDKDRDKEKKASKRASPVKDTAGVPPEKKAKVVEPAPEEPKKVEKPALPKPKRLVIQESDMFMDALITSTKKDVRKRKRRISASKDGTPDVKKEKEDTPPSSPVRDSDLSPVIKPAPKFYRDTLETSETEKDDKAGVKENDKGAGDAALGENACPSPSKEPEGVVDVDRVVIKSEPNGDDIEDESTRAGLPRGVLVHHKTRKGPKKSVRWKAEQELETIQFFELDETERVNVTKTFTDMKQMERTIERESFQLSRKLPQDDNMEEKTVWKFPVLIDVPKSEVQLGGKSKEKDVQYARETVVLSALYFNRASIPDSAAEPDSESHPATDPVLIPLEDTTGNPDTVSDFRAQGWPEPKPLLPPTSPSAAAAATNAFPPHFASFGGGPVSPVAGPPFAGMPPAAAGMFPPQGMMGPNGVGPQGPGGGDWRTGDGRVVAMDGTAMPMDMYSQQGGPAMSMGMPGVMGPPGGHMDMGYNMMGNPEEMAQYPMGPGYPMQGPPHMGPGPMGPGPPMQGPPMGFPPQFRGPMGPRGNRPPGRGGQWYRPNGSMGPGPHWRGGNRGWNRGGICHQFSSRGSCRMGSSCAFTH